MIRKIIKHPPKKRNLYGKYFLATEAPGDPDDPDTQQTEDQNAPDPTVQEVNPDDDTDFNPVGDDTPDVTEPDPYNDTNFNEIDDTPDPTPTEPQQDETAEAPPEGDMENQPQETPEEQPTDTTPAEQTPDAGGEQQPTQDTGDTETTTDTGGEDATQTQDAPTEGEETQTDNATGDIGEEEDTGEDDTDFNDMSDDTGGDSGNTGGEDTADNEKKGPGLEYESTRKYILFNEFISLYNAINNYITKLSNIINDDVETNRIVSISCNRLREIRDLTYDYITIKFEISSYTQSLLFYQNMIVAVQTIFRMLENISITKKEN